MYGTAEGDPGSGQASVPRENHLSRVFICFLWRQLSSLLHWVVFYLKQKASVAWFSCLPTMLTLWQLSKTCPLMDAIDI